MFRSRKLQLPVTPAQLTRNISGQRPRQKHATDAAGAGL